MTAVAPLITVELAEVIVTALALLLPTKPKLLHTAIAYCRTLREPTNLVRRSLPIVLRCILRAKVSCGCILRPGGASPISAVKSNAYSTVLSETGFPSNAAAIKFAPRCRQGS